jgi:hypothetical protein
MPLTDDELLVMYKRLAIDALPICGKYMEQDAWNRWYSTYTLLQEQLERRELDKD